MEREPALLRKKGRTPLVLSTLKKVRYRMIDHRGVINCDCCGRQILKDPKASRRSDDSVVSVHDAHLIGINKHCCRECYPDYELQQQLLERCTGWEW
jgi:hypothetical protein